MEDFVCPSMRQESKNGHDIVAKHTDEHETMQPSVRRTTGWLFLHTKKLLGAGAPALTTRNKEAIRNNKDINRINIELEQV